MRHQNTIAEEARCEGIALHGGGRAELVLRPGLADSGIVFALAGEGGPRELLACAEAVGSTTNATTLSNGDTAISTVEHLLASLHALQIDNVRLEIEGSEVPALDGSALDFVRLLRAAGSRKQAARRPSLQVLRPVEVVEGMRRISVEPAPDLAISYAIDFAHAAIGRQTLEIPQLSAEVFEEEIAPARTFGFLADVDALRRAGLAQGASLENTIVLDECGVVNPEGLRWPDEFVRHKILDLIGDLSLIGLPIRGHVRVERGGHALHHRLVRALLEAPEAWRVEESREGDAEAPARAQSS